MLHRFVDGPPSRSAANVCHVLCEVLCIEIIWRSGPLLAALINMCKPFLENNRLPGLYQLLGRVQFQLDSNQPDFVQPPRPELQLEVCRALRRHLRGVKFVIADADQADQLEIAAISRSFHVPPDILLRALAWPGLEPVAVDQGLHRRR